MKSEQITITSTAGLHAQLAAKLVNTASKYSVDFRLHYKDKVVDLKSILGLMSLVIPYGEEVRILAIGERCEEALADVASILK